MINIATQALGTILGVPGVAAEAIDCCCLCGDSIDKFNSNNPWPITDDEFSMCCGECNVTQVIPARVRLHLQTERNDPTHGVVTAEIEHQSAELKATT